MAKLIPPDLTIPDRVALSWFLLTWRDWAWRSVTFRGAAALRHA